MKFEQGQKIIIIWWNDNSYCKSSEGSTIVVCMENGQMAEVAWAEQIVNGVLCKYNLSLAQSVEMEEL